MCGIAGWVDFERDLAGDRATVLEMTRTMVRRGPDDEGLWLCGHAALGHRRLAVIDIEGGHQPMTVQAEGRTVAVITYSGEVYNFRELRAELASRGHGFRTRSDTEVVLRAYLEWGEDFVNHLNGMYAFALWDLMREELLLVRDRMGIKPLFYYPLPAGVLFGSEPKAILANPLADRTVDANGLREIFVAVKTPGFAVFRGMREVLPGQLVRIGHSGLTPQRYWTLQAGEHTDDLDTTVGTVRELLDDIVARQLVSDVPLCALLSGGLDSSVITALAAAEFRTAEFGRVRSFAVDFSGYTDNFKPDAMRDQPDAPFAHELARHVGAEHSDVTLNGHELTNRDVRAAVLRAYDRPTSTGDGNTSLYLLFRAIRKHSTVALSGEAADEVFGGYPWFFQPAAVRAQTFPWLVFFTFRQLMATVFDPALLAKLDLAAFEADSYRQALTEVPRIPGQPAAEQRMRELCYLHLTRFLQVLLDRKDLMSMAVGLEVRVPFCDHRLVQYVFNTPWAMKTFDGQEKSLLRAACADALPRSILQRRKAIYPTTQDPAYEMALRQELAGILDDQNSPAGPLLDRDAVRKLLASPAPKTTSVLTRMPLELALELNNWIGAYDVRLDV
jgi:asparagine synthase (glutamine-hydrolysing)